MENPMKTLNDFEKKYPDLYQAIFEKGKKDGLIGAQDKVVGGQVVASYNDNHQDGYVGDQDKIAGGHFEKLVQDYVTEGLSPGAAISRAVKKNPGAHREYLARLKTNSASKLPKKPTSNFKKFEEAVSDLMNQGRGSRADAIRNAVEKYPKLHTDYVARVKKGERGDLCQS